MTRCCDSFYKPKKELCISTSCFLWSFTEAELVSLFLLLKIVMLLLSLYFGLLPPHQHQYLFGPHVESEQLLGASSILGINSENQELCTKKLEI